MLMIRLCRSAWIANRGVVPYLLGLAWLFLSPLGQAQSISLVQPRSVKPGQVVQLLVHGSDLDDSLRLVSKGEFLQWQTAKVEPAQATLVVALSEDAPPGCMSLWLTTSTGVVKRHDLFVDNLDSVLDNGNNHAMETAQEVALHSTVEGTCDAAVSDFYRFHAKAGERVAVEVLTQPLRSTMDPVLRLLNADGKVLMHADDTFVGPDCSFGFQCEVEGDYLLEIHDSRHSAAAAAYQLRIGDFPIVTQCYPMVVQAGTRKTVTFVGPDGTSLAAREIMTLPSAQSVQYVPAKFDEGRDESWVPLYNSSLKQLDQSECSAPLDLPFGVNGRLMQPGEVDSYLIRGEKGRMIRVAAKSRSLGSPTLLQMQLFDSEGSVLAGTKSTEADEWSFDVTLPDEGVYRLQVNDLSKRGGDEFTYAIECTPSGSFSVALKADKATREEFMIEPGHGACAVELQIARFGYDGEIDLQLSEPDSGIRILNPRIPAKATEARVYLTAAEDWKNGSLDLMQFTATAVDNPMLQCRVNSHALSRVKEPYVIAPSSQSDGTIVLAAVPTTDPPFAFDPIEPVPLARPVLSHSAVLSLKRLDEKFKSGVEVIPATLPQGWTVSTQVDKDQYSLTIVRSHSSVEESTELPLQVYGEFNGRGRIERTGLPIQWFDPVRVAISFLEPLVSGGTCRAELRVRRAGNDFQPVKVELAGLPEGITCPEAVEISADQESTVLELQVAASLTAHEPQKFQVLATSSYEGHEFSVSSEHLLPRLEESPREIVVFPTEVDLTDPEGRQQLVVMGVTDASASRDWTRHARLTSTHPKVAEVRRGVLYPIADGETEVIAEVGRHRQVIPVRVSQRDTRRNPEFESEVLVALSKQGCNSGACHGSPSGKGGFRLSLRAFDKKLDELTLIREDFGRRTNPLDPQQSLLLLKPLMRVPHGGGKQLHQDDAAYKILLAWIAGGAESDPEGTARVTRLEIYPREKLVLSVGHGGQQLAVTAHFADGRSRDVTHLVAYETSDTSVATVDAHGFVTPHARGEVAILVRLLEFIESSQLMFTEDILDFQWTNPPTNNYIDQLVNHKLKQLQYLPAPTCTDDEFLRRVSLDLLGVLPTVEETVEFHSDSAEDKRARWIDQCLQREEFAKYWALKWGDLLKLTRKLVGDEGVYKYHRWLERSLHDNMPYDEFARQLLTGSGSTLASPPANFYRTATDMNECVETVSQVFLGARLQCAKCHNHPFERWTQDNYYGLGAFFHRVERRKTERPGELFVFTGSTGEVTQPRTGQQMSPWLPGVGNVETDSHADRRHAFIDWLVHPENPYFARIEANRIWSQLFARGIVDPIDDFRDSNPPSNDALLNALAADFRDSGYDRKHLLRRILNSRTYQASFQTTEFNQADSKYFSHQEPRLLGAEQLLDAINRTLALDQKFEGLPSKTLATQLPAPDLVKVEFLKVFGQPERSTVCACERAGDSNLGMAIELFNGPMVHEKLRDPHNRFRTAIAAGDSIDRVIREIYLAALCRNPSEIELNVALEHCRKSSDLVSGVEDVCWALFNTDEFLFQH